MIRIIRLPIMLRRYTVTMGSATSDLGIMAIMMDTGIMAITLMATMVLGLMVTQGRATMDPLLMVNPGAEDMAPSVVVPGTGDKGVRVKP